MDIIVTDINPVHQQHHKKHTDNEHVNINKLIVETTEAVISRIDDSTISQSKKLYNGINYLGSIINTINTNVIYQCIDGSDINKNICNVSPLIVADDNGKVSIQCPKYATLNTTTNKCVISVNELNMMNAPTYSVFGTPSVSSSMDMPGYPVLGSPSVSSSMDMSGYPVLGSPS